MHKSVKIIKCLFVSSRAHIEEQLGKTWESSIFPPKQMFSSKFHGLLPELWGDSKNLI